MRFVPDTNTFARAQQQVAVREGAPRFATSACATVRVAKGSWAYSFLHSTLRTTDAETFGKNDTSVFFEYLGAAAIGSPQLPRTELQCVAAHITPFACGKYQAINGSGRLAFLSSRSFLLTFAHLNGELTATFYGRCNALSTGLQVDGTTVVATGGGATSMGCAGSRASDDNAISDFFQGPLTFAEHRNEVTFTSPTGSVTFRK